MISGVAKVFTDIATEIFTWESGRTTAKVGREFSQTARATCTTKENGSTTDGATAVIMTASNESSPQLPHPLTSPRILLLRH